MKKPAMLALVALLAAAVSMSGESVALSQSACTGNGVQTGRIVVGTPGHDFINCKGSTIDLIIIGLDGNDWLEGGDGNDFISGGPGNDIVISRGGRDVIQGGPGRDFLAAGPGNDVLRGGPGDDLLFGGSGDDVLFGGDGDDELIGGDGMDLCDGQDGKGDSADRSCEIPAHVP